MPFKKVNGEKLIVGDERTELYRHFDNDGKLLYVGISWDAFDRYAFGHKRRAKWSINVGRITIERFPNRKSAEQAERLAIQNEKPLHNKTHSLTLAEQQQDDLPISLPRVFPSSEKPVSEPRYGSCVMVEKKTQKWSVVTVDFELNRKRVVPLEFPTDKEKLEAAYGIAFSSELVEQGWQTIPPEEKWVRK